MTRLGTRWSAWVVAGMLAAGLWAQPLMPHPGGAVPPAVATPAALHLTPDARTHPEWRLLRGQEAFWRLGQTHDGVWWFVSPAGEAEFLNTVTTVQPYQLARDTGGIHFVSRDWTGGVTDEGDLHHWAARTLERIRATGFKGLGAWSHHVFHQLDVPITRDLNLWTWVQPQDKRIYSPGWARTVEHAVKVQVMPLRDNRNLVGYFIDNEIDWGDGFAGPAFYFNHLPPDDPNRAEVMKVIRSLWPDIEAFNRDWNTALGSLDEIDAWETLPHPPGTYGRLFSAWLEHLARDYFRFTCRLIREHDPNHLILGVRFRGYAPREVVRASRDFTDAQSINYYVADGRLDREMFQMMHEESGQPVMITEYSFHALDGRSGNRNAAGFAAQVIDQQARAEGYRHLTARLARVPYIIGADWFQWHDEPPSGRAHDGEDVNFGIVDVDDHPYELLEAAVRETGPLLNSLHAGSARDDGRDVWRMGFEPTARASIPRLDRPIRINGELSDWPVHSLLKGMRQADSVGLERSPLPLPMVRLGWTEQGLYVGFEVFDTDIRGAPGVSSWWMRDHVEFWVSTRPVERRHNQFNAHAHQFFFVPNDWPDEHGRMGIVGQWHRPGDAQVDHLIPHPRIRSAARIFPDRYVVEIFIPAEALYEFDPANCPQLAFNINIRNAQQAIDYFWSAPKEMMTHLRPGTWGAIVLEGTAGPARPRTAAATLGGK